MKQHYYYVLQPGFANGTAYRNPKIPGTGIPRFGDIELDGYQDMILTISQPTVANTPVNTYFFGNVPCPQNIVDGLKGKNASFDPSNCRYLDGNQLNSQLSIIRSKTSYSVSFFDFAELG
jgi:hypothetical protein